MFTHNSHFTIEGNAKKTNMSLPDITMMNKNEGQNCKLTVSNKNHGLRSEDMDPNSSFPFLDVQLNKQMDPISSFPFLDVQTDGPQSLSEYHSYFNLLSLFNWYIF
jgi:hypothetical protein